MKISCWPILSCIMMNCIILIDAAPHEDEFSIQQPIFTHLYLNQFRPNCNWTPKKIPTVTHQGSCPGITYECILNVDLPHGQGYIHVSRIGPYTSTGDNQYMSCQLPGHIPEPGSWLIGSMSGAFDPYTDEMIGFPPLRLNHIATKRNDFPFLPNVIAEQLPMLSFLRGQSHTSECPNSGSDMQCESHEGGTWCLGNLLPPGFGRRTYPSYTSFADNFDISLFHNIHVQDMRASKSPALAHYIEIGSIFLTQHTPPGKNNHNNHNMHSMEGRKLWVENNRSGEALTSTSTNTRTTLTNTTNTSNNIITSTADTKTNLRTGSTKQKQSNSVENTKILSSTTDFEVQPSLLHENQVESMINQTFISSLLPSLSSSSTTITSVSTIDSPSTALSSETVSLQRKLAASPAASFSVHPHHHTLKPVLPASLEILGTDHDNTLTLTHDTAQYTFVSYYFPLRTELVGFRVNLQAYDGDEVWIVRGTQQDLGIPKRIQQSVIYRLDEIPTVAPLLNVPNTDALLTLQSTMEKSILRTAAEMGYPILEALPAKRAKSMSTTTASNNVVQLNDTDAYEPDMIIPSFLPFHSIFTSTTASTSLNSSNTSTFSNTTLFYGYPNITANTMSDKENLVDLDQLGKEMRAEIQEDMEDTDNTDLTPSTNIANSYTKFVPPINKDAQYFPPAGVTEIGKLDEGGRGGGEEEGEERTEDEPLDNNNSNNNNNNGNNNNYNYNNNFNNNNNNRNNNNNNNIRNGGSNKNPMQQGGHHPVVGQKQNNKPGPPPQGGAGGGIWGNNAAAHINNNNNRIINNKHPPQFGMIGNNNNKAITNNNGQSQQQWKGGVISAQQQHGGGGAGGGMPKHGVNNHHNRGGQGQLHNIHPNNGGGGHYVPQPGLGQGGQGPQRGQGPGQGQGQGIYHPPNNQNNKQPPHGPMNHGIHMAIGGNNNNNNNMGGQGGHNGGAESTLSWAEMLQQLGGVKRRRNLRAKRGSGNAKERRRPAVAVIANIPEKEEVLDNPIMQLNDIIQSTKPMEKTLPAVNINTGTTGVSKTEEMNDIDTPITSTVIGTNKVKEENNKNIISTNPATPTSPSSSSSSSTTPIISSDSIGNTITSSSSSSNNVTSSISSTSSGSSTKFIPEGSYDLPEAPPSETPEILDVKRPLLNARDVLDDLVLKLNPYNPEKQTSNRYVNYVPRILCKYYGKSEKVSAQDLKRAQELHDLDSLQAQHTQHQYSENTYNNDNGFRKSRLLQSIEYSTHYLHRKLQHQATSSIMAISRHKHRMSKFKLLFDTRIIGNLVSVSKIDKHMIPVKPPLPENDFSIVKRQRRAIIKEAAFVNPSAQLHSTFPVDSPVFDSSSDINRNIQKTAMYQGVLPGNYYRSAVSSQDLGDKRYPHCDRVFVDAGEVITVVQFFQPRPKPTEDSAKKFNLGEITMQHRSSYNGYVYFPDLLWI